MDLHKICDFIFDRDEKRIGDVELEETFVAGEEGSESPMELIQRIKREVKSGQHEQHEAIRMAFVNGLIEGVNEMQMNETDSYESESLGEEVCLNTLFHYGFYKFV